MVAHAALSSSTARQTVSSSPPRPPNRSGNGRPEDSLGGQKRAEVLGELGRPVDLGGPRGDLLAGEGADGVADRDLVLGEPVQGEGGCHGAADRSTAARPASRGAG